MCPSRRRAPRLFDPKADYRSDVTIYRAGAMFIIPAKYIGKKSGLINKHIAKLIRNATKESIIKLEEMGVVCRFGEVPEVGTERRFA